MIAGRTSPYMSRYTPRQPQKVSSGLQLRLSSAVARHVSRSHGTRFGWLCPHSKQLGMDWEYASVSLAAMQAATLWFMRIASRPGL